MNPNKNIAIAAGIMAGIIALSGGGIYLLGDKDSAPAPIAESELLKVEKTDLRTSTATSGTIAPLKEVALTTSLSGPISTLDAKVGQRVDRGQLLATIDVSTMERELKSQRAEQKAQSLGDLNQAEQAQQQLNQLRERLDKGLNQDVNAARAGVRQAQEAYDTARADADFTGGGEVAQARAALQQARSALITANSQSLQSGFSVLGQTSQPEVDPSTYATSLLSFTDTTTAVSNAQRQLQEAEQTLNRAVARQDQTAADKERTAQSAWATLADAKRSLEAAQLRAAQELNTQAKSVADTVEVAAASRANRQASLEKTEQDMQGADIISPLAGIITQVEVGPGQVASGPILSIADDSVKLIHVTVKEADLAKIKVGNGATFTSASVPDKEFKGTVDFISPVALAGEGQAKKKATFAVDIKVNGSAPRLPLGARAKVKIITSETKGVITVPLTAVYEDKGKTFIQVAKDEEVTEKEVKTGDSNDFQVAILSGLKPGETVLKQAKFDYTDRFVPSLLDQIEE